MGRSIFVQLDDEALHALSRIEATGLSRSAAVKKALVDASDRLRRSDSLRAEVAALESNTTDRREMRETAAFMQQLRAEPDEEEWA